MYSGMLRKAKTGGFHNEGIIIKTTKLTVFFSTNNSSSLKLWVYVNSALEQGSNWLTY